MKENNTPVTIRRRDYTPATFHVDSVFLVFNLEPTATVVSSTLALRHHADSMDTSLVLDGVDLELLSITLDGQSLEDSCYTLTDEHLTLPALPDQCELTVVTRINPEQNAALEGLYLSSGNYCTQCEAEGFRKITYYPDRPDVLSKFSVRIERINWHTPFYCLMVTKPKAVSCHLDVTLCSGQIHSLNRVTCLHWWQENSKP